MLLTRLYGIVLLFRYIPLCDCIISSSCTTFPACNLHEIVFAAAYGYSWYHVEIFVQSLRQVVHCGTTLVMFVSEDVMQETQIHLLKYHANLVHLSPEWPFVKESAFAGKLTSQQIRALIPKGSTLSTKKDGGGVSMTRFFVADVWLAAKQAECGESASSVHNLALFADVADVMFQADPFPRIKELRRLTKDGHVFVFEERSRYRLGTCAFTRLGVKRYTARYVHELANQTVVNSGVVVGTLHGVRRLIDAMRKMVLSHDPIHQLNDQAALNILARGVEGVPQLQELKVLPASNSLGRHMGLTVLPTQQDHNATDVRLRLDAEGWIQVIGETGHPVAILHQYDRSLPLTYAVTTRWRQVEWEGMSYDHVRQLNPRNLENLVLSGPCPSLLDCCEHRLKLRDAIDAFTPLDIDTFSEIRNLIQHCVAIPYSVPIAFNFHIAHMAKRVLDRNGLYGGYNLIHFLHEMAILFSERSWAPSEDAPWGSVLLAGCLDKVCWPGNTNFQMRTHVLWKIYEKFLLWAASFYSSASQVLSKFIKALKPKVWHQGDLWIRWISRTDGLPENPVSRSALLESIRPQKFSSL